jgi:hypothetical protein
MQDRRRSNQRVHPVTGEAKSVHPTGQPISHSTNRGFNRRGKFGMVGKDCLPCVEVAGPGREEGKFSAMFGRASIGASAPRWLCPFPSRPLGVGQQPKPLSLV